MKLVLALFFLANIGIIQAEDDRMWCLKFYSFYTDKNPTKEPWLYLQVPKEKEFNISSQNWKCKNIEEKELKKGVWEKTIECFDLDHKDKKVVLLSRFDTTTKHLEPVKISEKEVIKVEYNKTVEKVKKTFGTMLFVENAKEKCGF